MKNHLRVVALALALVVLWSAPALACGGLFSLPPALRGTAPALQNVERILFVRDPATKKSTVWVELHYSGPASSFGWVLPLPKVPKVGVGTSYLFDRLDLATEPRFAIASRGTEGCRAEGGGSGIDCGSGAVAGVGGPAALSGGTAGVTTLQHAQVGPYDYQVLQGKSADAVLKWLNDNGFAVPDQAKLVLADHVAKGDVFVAVKLAPGVGTEQIKPLALEMDDAELCVPLRLAAIAAEKNTTVQLYVAGPGRAIPKNYLHVRINPARIDLLHIGKNYGEVVAAAVDEGAGRAFITEFAGELPTAVWDPSGGPNLQPLVDYTAIDTSGVAKATTACAAWTDLAQRRFPITKETVALIEPVLQLAAKAKLGDSLMFYQYGLTDCSRDTQAVDGAALANTLEKEFAGPLRELTKVLTTSGVGGAGKGRLTRLVTRISPDEMTRDPVFAYSATLPNVSNVTTGSYDDACRYGGSHRLTIDGQGSWLFVDPTETTGDGLPTAAADWRFATAPAALMVEILDETGEPTTVDASQIALVDQAIAGAKPGEPSLPSGIVLKKPAARRWTPPPSDATLPVPTDPTCSGRGPRRDGLWLLVGLLGVAAGVVRARRRREQRGQ